MNPFNEELSTDWYCTEARILALPRYDHMRGDRVKIDLSYGTYSWCLDSVCEYTDMKFGYPTAEAAMQAAVEYAKTQDVWVYDPPRELQHERYLALAKPLGHRADSIRLKIGTSGLCVIGWDWSVELDYNFSQPGGKNLPVMSNPPLVHKMTSGHQYLVRTAEAARAAAEEGARQLVHLFEITQPR